MSIHPDSRPKTAFTCPYGKFPMETNSLRCTDSIKYFFSLMFKLFFIYLDNFLDLWMHNLLILARQKRKLETYVISIQKVLRDWIQTDDVQV